VGTWGAGPFQNDDALDFLGQLSELPAAGLGARVRSALALAAGGYLELPEACAAIAAARLIAVACGAVFAGMGEEVIDLAQSDGVIFDVQLADLALAALARVNGEPSEWRELWPESEFGQEAGEMIAGLRAMLA
jgi:hypothetical protein